MSSAGGRITAGAGVNLLNANAKDRNAEATCYVGNLDEQVTEEMVWELFVQAGPLGKTRKHTHERSREKRERTQTRQHLLHSFPNFLFVCVRLLVLRSHLNSECVPAQGQGDEFAPRLRLCRIQR